MKTINTTTAATTTARIINAAMKAENDSPRGMIRTLLALTEGTTAPAAEKAVEKTAAALAAAENDLKAARKRRGETTEGTTDHATAVQNVAAATAARDAAKIAANNATAVRAAFAICDALNVSQKSNRDARRAAALKLLEIVPLFTRTDAGIKPAKLTAEKDAEKKPTGRLKATRTTWLEAAGQIAAALELATAVRRNEQRIAAVRDEQRIAAVRDEQRIAAVRDEQRIAAVRDEQRIAAVRDEQRRITALKIAAAKTDAARDKVREQRADSEKMKIAAAEKAAREDIARARAAAYNGHHELTAGAFYTLEADGTPTPCEVAEADSSSAVA